MTPIDTILARMEKVRKRQSGQWSARCQTHADRGPSLSVRETPEGATKVVELDAAPVKLLQSKLREAIRSVIDIVEYNAQIELEESDASNVEAHRRVVFDAIGQGE